MAINSKQKGASFERKIAKILSEWYYKDPDALVRNIHSGSLATFRKGKGLPGGDIMQVKHHEKPFPYSVECKCHREFKMVDILFPKLKSVAWKAWEQCERDAKSTNKIPFLVFKSNNQDIYVCTTDTIDELLDIFNVVTNSYQIAIFTLKDLINGIQR